MNETKTSQKLVTEFEAAYFRFMVTLEQINQRLPVESAVLFPTIQQMCDDFEAATGMSLEKFNHLPRDERARLIDNG